MREQITFAVDANRCSHYVGLTDAMKMQLSVEDAGAAIDEWPGDLPTDLVPGFYSATLDVSGSVDNPELKWTKVLKMQVYPPWVKITEIPEHKEKVKRVRKKKEDATEPALGVRIRRKGEVM